MGPLPKIMTSDIKNTTAVVPSEICLSVSPRKGRNAMMHATMAGRKTSQVRKTVGLANSNIANFWVGGQE